MGNKGWLALLVLVAAGAVVWLLGGTALFAPGAPAGDGGDAARTDPALLGHQGSGPDAIHADTPGQASRGPVLFGRARELKVGVGALAGRVMDFHRGEAVAGARVVLSGTGYGGELIAQQVAADAEGRFRLPELPAGDAYALHVSDGAAHTRMLEGIAVDADGLRDLGTIWLGERGALEGVVVDADGTGVVGAQVQVHGGGSLMELLENLAELMEHLDRDAKPIAEAVSEAGGRFRVEGLDPGPINVVVRAPGYRQTMVPAVMTSAGAAGGRVTVRVVVGAAVTGIVVDERDRPVGGARVACLDSGDFNAAFFGRQFSLTGADGRFRIESPPTLGEFAVIVAADGYPTLMTQVKGDAGEHRFVLVGGAEVVVRLLQSPGDRPVEGARLTAMFGEGKGPDAREMTFASGSTDHRGEALFHARPGALQMLWYTHPEQGNGMWSPMMPADLAGQLRGPKDATVKRPRTELVVRVERGVTIAGRVTDPDGRPIQGARCRSMGQMGFSGAAMTDADGRYVLPGQGALVMLVVVTAPGYVQRTPDNVGTLPKPDDRGEVILDVVMDPAATVTGRVLGPAAQPLAGARVKLGANAGNAVLSSIGGADTEAITNVAGRYVLDGARPGKGMRVLARMAGYLDGRTDEFEIAAGKANAAPDVRLRLGSRLVVEVREPDGGAAVGARVEISVERSPDALLWEPMQGFRGFADQVTAEGGRTTVEDVPDGSVTVTGTSKGFAAARQVLAVKREDGGGTQRVTLSLREAHALRGRVLDPEGRGVAGAAVASSAASGEAEEDPSAWVPTVTAATDAEGRFVLEGLPARPVRVEVHAEGFRRGSATVEDPRTEVEVRVTPVPADAQARLAEIQKELMEIYQRFGSVKDDGERKALTQRMMALQAEQRALQGEDGGSGPWSGEAETDR